MITCDQKTLRGKLFSLFIFLTFHLVSVSVINAQTPVTQYPCDPRSTANAGTCPGGCSFAPAVEKGCNCFDSIDNDGDGKVDAADISDCAQYFGLSFVGPGTSNCSLVPPGGNPFAGIGAPAESQQNTADTQSKVAAGDVTGDGVPETVITSKWNNEVRVINPNGTVNASYNLSGKKSLFSGFTDVDGKTADPDRLLLEHEVLIVDIKRASNQPPDKKGEIFAIVSARKGNPKIPPSGFYLLALTWTKPDPNGLQLIYDPIPLGTNRPGIFGVADMDGDGFAEIYLRDRIYAAETGKLLASDGNRTHLNTTNWDSDVTAAPVAVNVQGDTKMELVCGTKVFTIPSLTNRNPAAPSALTLVKDMNVDFPATKCFVKLMNDPVEYGVDTHSSTSVADIDRDGSIDVVIAGALNSSVGRTAVFYWNLAKNKVDYVLTPSSAELGLAGGDPNFANYSTGWIWGTGRVNIGDANGDGKSDLTFMAGNQLFCVTTNASDNLVTLWTQNQVNTAKVPIGYRTVNDSRSGVLTATIYDFDNDGQPEMVYRDSQSLNVIDGATGTVLKWSVVCQSHTYTEGPIIADVNGDGATDICVTCNTSNSFDINDDIQQQALGQVRLYFTNGQTWLPTRKVWNQPGYFVVNINDDLTLPFPQLDQSTVFSNAPCPNGTPGPQRPMNVFLNQVPFLNANGCPVFPAPDLTFSGDDPNTPGVDTDGNGVVEPAIIVTPPICGNLDITVQIRYANIGDIPITDAVPVSFFKGDPRLPGAIRLHNTVINITNLQVGQSILSSPITFNGDGLTFDMYVALYNDGSILPIPSSGQTTKECQIQNNVYSVQVVPSPFTAQINKFQDNLKCVLTDPNTGELRARVFKGATEVFDFSPYAFQWYSGIGISNPIAAAQGGQSPTITGLDAGDYTLVVTNTQKNCSSAPVSINVVTTITIPAVTVNVLSNQTQCNPPNGKLEALVAGGNTGYSFAWFSNAVSLGITTSIADGLKGDNYTVVVSRNGCTTAANAQVQDLAQEPDASGIGGSVVDCLNPNSGTVSGQASIAGVAQNPADYTFNWYFYNGPDPGGTRGSILPAINGTGPNRTGLAAGYYELEVINNLTQCVGVPKVVVQVTNSTLLPTASFTSIIAQTSCDPLNPNGSITAIGAAPGFTNPADFTFEWFRGDNTLPANKIPIAGGPETIAGTKGEIINKVKGGGLFYTVKITTPLNCSATNKIIIPEDVNVPVITLTPVDNTICDPLLAGTNFNGSVTASVTFKGVSVSLPNPDYEFNWFDGTQVSDPPIAVADDKNPILSQRDGGFYTATVDLISLGCQSLPATEEVINSSAPPVIVMGAVGSTNCTTAPNGQALVSSIDTNPVPSPSGILAPYTFEWFNGNTTAPSSLIAGANDGILEGRQGAVGAFFTVRVTNQSNGCSNTSFIEVPDARVIPLVTLGTTPNTICNAALTNPLLPFTGTVTATVTNQVGAISDYTFAWTDNETNTPLGAFTGTQLTQRDSSRYTTVATHLVSGCVSAPVSAQVLNVTSLPALVMGAVGSTNCTTAPDGKALVASIDLSPVPNPSGILSPYAFEWFTGNTTASPIAGANDGILEGRQGAVGAFFTARVTNQSNGCQNTGTVEVPDARVIPLVTLGTTPNTICNAALTNPFTPFTGTVTATVTNQVGAIGDYTFAWTDNETNTPLGAFTGAQLTQRDSSRYTTIVTHVVSGCVSAPVSAQVLNVTSLPALVMGAVGSTNCTTAPDGKALVASIDLNPVPNPSGILSPYAFEWFTGNTTASPIAGAIDGILEGRQGAVGAFFTTRVTNQSNGCQNTGTVEVPDNRVIPVVTLGTTPNLICNPALTNPFTPFSGTVTATVTNQVGAISDYTFAWTDNETNTALSAFTGTQLTQRDSSRYTTIVTHVVSGCVSAPVSAQVLNTTSLPALEMGQVASTNCVPALANGKALVTKIDGTSPDASGILSPYAFEWFTGNTTTSPVAGAIDGILENRQGGIGSFFTTQVTNQSNGCQNTAVVEVSDNKSLPIVTLTSTPNKNCSAPFDGIASVNTILYKNVDETLSGGYTYSWTRASDVTNTVISTNTSATALQKETYELVVTRTDIGCTSNPVQVEVDDDLYIPVINIATTSQSSCDINNPNGVVSASMDETSVGGGAAVTSGYSYQWTNDGNPFASGGTPVGNTSSVTGLNGNLFFTVTVERNLTRCVNSKTTFLPEDIKIPKLELNATDIVDCKTPGFIEAKVFIDLNNDGDTNDPGEDLSTATIDSDYTFVWYRGTDITVTPLPGIDRVLDTLSLAPYLPLPPDNYTAIAINTITKCVSSDFTDVVNGPGPLFEIAYNVNFKPASCAADEGVITAFIDIDSGAPVVPSTMGFTFEWYAGTITNGLQTPPPSFYTDPIVSFNGSALQIDPLSFYGSASYPVGQPLPNHQAPTSATTGPTLYGRQSGTYTVVATRTVDGCKEFLTTYLPFQVEPVVIVVDIIPDDCLGDNGEISVDIAVPAFATPDQYKVWMIPGNNPVLTPTVDPTTPFAPIDPAQATGNVFSNLASGTYTIVAQEDINDIATGCFSAPVYVEMREALPPLLNGLSAGFNTSCSPIVGDGSLEITFVTDPSDPFSPGFPVPPFPIIFTPAPQKYSVNVIDASNTVVFTTGGYTNDSGDILTIPGLVNGDFTVTVESSQGCPTTKTLTVPWNPKVAEISGNVIVLPALACDPNLELNASVEIVDLLVDGAPDNLSDYLFDWFTDASLSAPSNILSKPGDNTIVKGGEILSNDPTAPLPLPSVTITVGSYWARATKVNAGTTGGVGCSSAPIKVDIEDQSVNPTVVLTPVPDTSCELLAFFEGSINAQVTDPGSMDPTLFAPPFYNYNWVTSGVSTITDNTSDGEGSGPDDNFTLLSDGTYTLTVTNNASGCIGFAQTTIVKSATPIVVTKATAIDQDICFPAGSIQVDEILVGGSPEIPGNFDFTWYRNDLNTIIPLPLPANQGVDLIDINNVPDISAGTYYVKVKKRQGLFPGSRGSGCESAPFRKDILDQSVDPVVKLTPFSNTACDAFFEGSIQLDVTTPSGPGGASQYTYRWTSNTTTTPADNGTFVLPNGPHTGTGVGNELIANGAIAGVGLEDGIYTLTATNNQTGCAASSQTIITETATPIVITKATPTDQLICFADGSVQVDEILVGGVVNNNFNNFDFTWARGDVNTIIPLPLPANQGVSLIDINNVPDISADSYFVSVKKRPGLNPGSGCESAPFRVDILDQSADPVVKLTPFSNTACDNFFEGSIQLDVATPTGPGGASQYTYRWTSSTTTTPADNGNFVLPNGPHTGTGVGNELIVNGAIAGVGLEHGTYTLTATNNQTGCAASSQTIITEAATPIVITKATPTDQLICFADGSVQVDEILVGGVVNNNFNNFDFTWARGDVNTIIPLPLPANQGVSLIDINNVPDISADSYFVSVKKRPGLNPGSGCLSNSLRVDILDQSADPVVNLTPFSNSACDTFFEGSIQLDVTTPTGPGGASQYTYRWTSSTTTTPADNGNFVLPNGPHTGTGVGNELIANGAIPAVGLEDGTYTLTAFNNQTGCSASSQTVITKSATPIVITRATPTDQLICLPDGSVQVDEILVGGVVDNNYNNFDFTWARGDVNTIIPLPLPANQGVSLIDINNVPDISADSYFVSVKKRPGLNPGSGCESAPFKVDIKDLSEDPQLQFTFVPNSGCSSLLPNGEVLATASERDATIDNYTFNWLLNNAALPGSITRTDINNTSQLIDAPDGSYTLSINNTVTGCSFTSGVNVTIDLSLSLPNIITVNTIEPTTCIGDGSAEVTSISIGGGAPLSGAAIAPPNFEYEWYVGSFPGTPDLNVNPLFAPLATGKYFVRVKDLTTDCISAPTEVNLNDLNIIYPTLTLNLTTPQISCDNSVIGTGVIRADVTADNANGAFANPDYTFEWFNNLNLAPPTFSLSPASPATFNILPDLKSGDYSLKVTNSKTGCVSDAIYIVPDNAPQFQPQLVLSTSNRTHCINPDGRVLAGVVNINPQYPFTPLSFTAEFYIGDVVNNLPAQPDIPMMDNTVDPFTNAPFLQNFETLDTLRQGFYTVRVTDNYTGCESVKAIEVKDNTQPPIIDIVPENPNINCDNTIANGQLSATADGNKIAGYTFDWYTGTTIPNGATPIVTDDNRLIGFLAGDYSVRVTNDLTGCVSDKNGAIEDGVVLPPAPTAIVVRDRTNCVTPNGWVTASVNGITIAHTFDWYDGSATKPSSDFVGADYFDRDIGPYTVTATDLITRCVSQPATVTVKDARVIPVLEVVSTPALCLTPSGVITLTLVNNQEVTLTDITWVDDQTNAIVGRGPEVYELPAGFYTAEVISSESCEATISTEIETEILSYNLVSVNGDTKNDVWIIDCLQQFPGNNVKVFNRSGVKVYEADGYNNADVVFRGIGENGVYFLGDQLPDGTYFYIIDKRNGSKPITGYLELVR